ncbi:MAG: T9SS type A sorting domain-containing protein [Candidatus Zhuqueibacterota bacterium]
MKIRYSLMTVVFLLILLELCFAQWSTDPSENARISAYGEGPFITTDGKGGGIIAWHYDYIVAQRIDSAGYLKWATNGVPICRAKLNQSIKDIASDGQGGAYIVWLDFRRSVKPGYLMDSSDVYLQHVDSNGQVLWQENGMRISNGINYAFQAGMASDDSGGVVIAWASQYSYDYPVDNAINLQRISSTGEFLWLEDSVKILAPLFSQDPSMAIINDGNNGFIVSCSEGIFRFDMNGEITWHVADIPGRMTDYSLVSDGAGGAIFYYFNHNNFNYKFYIQRLNNEGVALWEENGIFIDSGIPMKFMTSIVQDREHGAYISWIDSSYIYHYDRIDSSGNLLWLEDNISFGFYLSDPNLLSDEQGNVICVFRDSLWNENGKMQKLNNKGEEQWNNNGILFSCYAWVYSNYDMISDGDNGIIIVWYERESEPHYGIFAQRVNKYGQLGMITSIKHPIETQLPSEYGLSQNWPNPFNSSTTIRFQLPESNLVTLEIYNMMGQKIKTLINGEYKTGGFHLAHWDGRDDAGIQVSSGIYVCYFRAGKFFDSKKLILMK